MLPVKSCIVEITKYSKKGLGEGYSELFSKPIEVLGAHPKEKVLAEIIRKKQGKHQGKLLEVLEAHPHRLPPRCQHAGTCGGCSFQSLAYSEQCVYKERSFKELFKDIMGECLYYPMIAMEEPWAFRNKMEFTFQQDKQGKKFLGLIMSGTKGKVVSLQECHVTRPWMIEVLLATQKWWEESALKAYHRFTQEGTLHTLTLREGMRTGEKMVILTIAGEPCAHFSHETLQAFKQAMLATVTEKLTLFLQIKHIQKGTPTSFHEMVLHGPDHIREKLRVTYPDGMQKELTFKISPSSFFQPNTEQAEKLFTRALALAGMKERDLIVDLYCGTATLGILFAPLAKKVIGVELNPYAVFDAEVNQEVNGIHHMEVKQGDVKDLQLGSEKIDLMILDPPRAGLGVPIVEKIAALKPQEILYISCHPMTQHEDIKEFLKKGYELKAMQPVDQFPHTPHLENIALLCRL